MNEELKQQAQEALGIFIKDVLSAKEFVVDQAPDIIQQVLTWGVYDAWLGIGIGISLTIIAIALFCMSWFSDGEFLQPMGIVFGSIIGFIAFLFISLNISQLVKVKSAPKVYLIEYAVGLMKEKSK